MWLASKHTHTHTHTHVRAERNRESREVSASQSSKKLNAAPALLEALDAVGLGVGAAHLEAVEILQRF